MITFSVDGVAVVTRRSLTEHEAARVRMPRACVLMPRPVSVVQTRAAALQLEGETESPR